MRLSKNAKILQKLIRSADRQSGAWLCEIVEYNASLGMKRTEVYGALRELLKNRLARTVVPSLRDPKNPKLLVKNRTIDDLEFLRIQYLESAPISTRYLEEQIARLAGTAAAIEDDQLRQGWINKYSQWDVDQKIMILMVHFQSVIQCFNLMNLRLAVKGLHKVGVAERSRLLRYYRMAFKIMKKDKDYMQVWPTVRYGLIVGDVEHSAAESMWFSSLRMPLDPCSCGHTLREHDSVSDECDHKETCACKGFNRS